MEASMAKHPSACIRR
ncbi:hypothetical protein LINPERHAP1_LOCUS33918 [Linum perenne]